MNAFVRTAAKGVLQIQGMQEEMRMYVMGRGGSCCENARIKPGLSSTGMPQLKAEVSVCSLYKLL